MKAGPHNTIPSHHQRIRRPAFTAVEVIIVLALLAAILSLIVINFPRLEGAFSKRHELDTARLAVREAHLQARETQNTVALSFDPESQLFLITNPAGLTLARLTMPTNAGATVTFRRLKPEPKPTSEPTWDTEDTTIATAIFAPSGPSTPFAMEVQTQAGFHRLIFDPFTHDTWFQADE